MKLNNNFNAPAQNSDQLMVRIGSYNNTLHLIVGSRSITISEDEALIMGFLINEADNEGSFSMNFLSENINLKSTEKFESIFNQLLLALNNFPIANDGGTDDVVYDYAISGRDLIIHDQHSYKFNKELAKKIGPKPIISSTNLYKINHRPHWFQPKF